MKKLVLFVSLCVLSITAIKAQDQQKECDPCERACYYALRASKASNTEEVDKMYGIHLAYKNECIKRKQEGFQRCMLYTGGAAVAVLLIVALVSRIRQ